MVLKAQTSDIGQSTEILFASHDEFERATQVVYSDLEIGNNAEISVKQKRKDGSIFDAHLQLSLFNDSDPAKRVVVCCTTDVSTKPESEDRLHKSDERYRASLEESFDGAVILEDRTYSSRIHLSVKCWVIQRKSWREWNIRMFCTPNIGNS